MVGQPFMTAHVYLFDAKHIDQVLRQLIRHATYVDGAASIFVIMFLVQDPVGMLDHGYATPARRYYGVDVSLIYQRPKSVQEMPGHFTGFVAVTGVERRLPTTGLTLGEGHGRTVSLEEIYGGHTDLGI